MCAQSMILLEIRVSPICLASLYLVAGTSIEDNQPFHQSFNTKYRDAKHIGLTLISNTPLQGKALICSPGALNVSI